MIRWHNIDVIDVTPDDRLHREAALRVKTG